MIHFTIPAIDVQAKPTRRKPNPRWTRKWIGAYASLRPRQYSTVRGQKYLTWKLHVCKCANQAGLETPLYWTKENPAYMLVVTYFRDAKRRNPDCENVQKLVRDSLAYVLKGTGARGDDEWVAGAHTLPQYDLANPRVEVWIFGQYEIARYLMTLRMAMLPFSHENGESGL